MFLAYSFPIFLMSFSSAVYRIVFSSCARAMYDAS